MGLKFPSGYPRAVDSKNEKPMKIMGLNVLAGRPELFAPSMRPTLRAVRCALPGRPCGRPKSLPAILSNAAGSIISLQTEKANGPTPGAICFLAGRLGPSRTPVTR